MTGFTVPDVRRGSVAKASAEDMDGAIAAIAIHGCMCAVDVTADEAWGFFLVKEIVDDQGGVHIGLLLFLLNDVRRVGGTIEVVAKFDKIEACTTNRATVGSFYPWSQARVVEVVAAWKEVSDNFVVYGVLTVGESALVLFKGEDDSPGRSSKAGETSPSKLIRRHMKVWSSR